MDKAFGGDGSSAPSADTMEEASTCLYFPADVQESVDQYRYILDLPGVPKSDIKVSNAQAISQCCPFCHVLSGVSLSVVDMMHKCHS